MANHGKVTYLNVIIGGEKKPPLPYPGFNGQIANIAIKFGPGAFVSDYNIWQKHLENRCPHPLADYAAIK